MIGKLLTSIFGAGLEPVNKIIRTVAGDKAEREEYAADENIAAKTQFAAEFQNYTYRTWWDSLMDGMNRLPRPLIVFSVLYMFFMAYNDPAKFSVVMAALALVPQPLWDMLYLIIGFYLPSRVLEKLPAFQPITTKKAKEIRDAAKDVIELKLALEKKAIATARASGNPSIAEWKKNQTS